VTAGECPPYEIPSFFVALLAQERRYLVEVLLPMLGSYRPQSVDGLRPHRVGCAICRDVPPSIRMGGTHGLGTIRGLWLSATGDENHKSTVHLPPDGYGMSEA